MNETVTKRLHISGLTPALTSADISTRLSTFGTVKSLDGFGKLDGVGQPRKFGYVTLETTPQALKKCLTTLSGSTWKGTRLRIGEAKPDYADRLRKEHAIAEVEPPKKKQRIRQNKYSAVLAEDMALVTRDSAAGRPGWKVMPSGRVVRAMRMRPGRPLPPVPGKEVKKLGERKMKIKEPDVRARRRKIDVTQWDGAYIRGDFLGSEEVTRRISQGIVSVPVVQATQEEDGLEREDEDQDSEEESVQAEEALEVAPEPLAKPPKSLPPPPSISTSPVSLPQPTSSMPATASSTLSSDLQAEKSQTLSFLHSLFDSALSSSHRRETLGASIDWDSDIDLDDVEAQVIERKSRADTDDDEFEVVPQDSESQSIRPVASQPNITEGTTDMDIDSAGSPSHEAKPDPQHQPSVPPTAKPPKSSALKDLFAPREDEGGFSLLNHLDLELDEDVDLGIDFAPSAPAISAEPNQDPVPSFTAPTVLPSTSATTATNKNSRSRAPIVLDPKKPLFFPRSISLAAGAQAASSPFYEKPTEEQIQQRWEDSKLELTRAWKKRWKEAGKIRRRKGGGIGGEEDGS
ncbi:hypothetical protein K435DRAFT_785238 [Dendrothele bispora CBS 962.96]|uniref:RRM domain-containing protein n=1 Tax=Dendrothele bispora (strain CBS 962.96) TaxID=1314807 RepID=A0A4S8KYF9_DENBC|nr:hypothetical protein K435DRAFT_785238 [Dendrothele bispora CBS 962.96]